MAKLKRFWRGRQGGTAIEYSLVAAMMAIMAITAASAMSDSISNVYEEGIVAKVNGAVNP